MSTLSTRDSLTARELPRPAADVIESRSPYRRLLSRPLLHKLLYLGGDLLAITLAHAAAFRIAGHALHIPTGALNPLEYHRYYIPFFAASLWFFEGYKS